MAFLEANMLSIAHLVALHLRCGTCSYYPMKHEPLFKSLKAWRSKLICYVASANVFLSHVWFCQHYHRFRIGLSAGGTLVSNAIEHSTFNANQWTFNLWIATIYTAINITKHSQIHINLHLIKPNALLLPLTRHFTLKVLWNMQEATYIMLPKPCFPN